MTQLITYTLKLVSGYNYNLYLNGTQVSDSDLATLFASAGSAYFVFDFNGGTPSNLTRLTIVDSNSTTVVSKTNLGTGFVVEDRKYKGVWDDSATTFASFAGLLGRTLDESQISFLMGKIKEGGGGVITLKYSDYNPTLVTTPQPLGKFLYESGVKTGDTVVIENDTNEPFMYIVATEGVSYYFTIKTVPCYIVNNNDEYDGSGTYFQFYINISGISYKWSYYISGSNYEFGSETIISSNNVKPYGSDYYDPYDVLSAVSGNALSTLVQVATNISGLSPVEGTFSGLVGFITCDQQKTPGDPEWYGEMEVSSTTPYNFETASVGTSIYVYVRSDAGLPLYYSPTDWAEPFQITDTSGNTIEVSEYILDQSGQPTSDYVNFVPGQYIMLQKFSNGWGFINVNTNAQYLPRTITTS